MTCPIDSETLTACLDASRQLRQAIDDVLLRTNGLQLPAMTRELVDKSVHRCMESVATLELLSKSASDGIDVSQEFQRAIERLAATTWMLESVAMVMDSPPAPTLN